MEAGDVFRIRGYDGLYAVTAVAPGGTLYVRRFDMYHGALGPPVSIPVDANVAYLFNAYAPATVGGEGWEYCRVVPHLEAADPDGYAGREWFEAFADGPTGSYTAATSGPVTFIRGEPHLRQATLPNIRVFVAFVQKLLDDGWEPVGERRVDYFQLTLRREFPRPPRLGIDGLAAGAASPPPPSWPLRFGSAMHLERRLTSTERARTVRQRVLRYFQEAEFRGGEEGGVFTYRRGSIMATLVSFSPARWRARANVQILPTPDEALNVLVRLDVDTTGQTVTRRERDYWERELDDLMATIRGEVVGMSFAGTAARRARSQNLKLVGFVAAMQIVWVSLAIVAFVAFGDDRIAFLVSMAGLGLSMGVVVARTRVRGYTLSQRVLAALGWPLGVSDSEVVNWLWGHST